MLWGVFAVLGKESLESVQGTMTAFCSETYYPESESSVLASNHSFVSIKATKKALLQRMCYEILDLG